MRNSQDSWPPAANPQACGLILRKLATCQTISPTLNPAHAILGHVQVDADHLRQAQHDPHDADRHETQALNDRATARPGDTVRCQLLLDRTPNFDGAMDIELIELESRTGFTAKRVRIEPGETRAEVSVRMGDVTSDASDVPLKFRAVGQLSDAVKVIFEASISLHVTR